MSMKVTVEKGNKKIAINATTTQCNVIEKTQEISDDDDDDDEEEDDIQEKGVSFVEYLVMLHKIKKCSFLDD